jgi:hypothetical protein
MTTAPPMNRTGRTFTSGPPDRKNGAIARVTSSFRNSAQKRKFTTLQPRAHPAAFDRALSDEGGRHSRIIELAASRAGELPLGGS